MENENPERKGIYDYLVEHGNKKEVSFHMPGHKGMDFFVETGYADFFKNMADYDLTEIPGADNLFQPEGIIGETMERYRKFYEAKKSFLLVNGSSCGIVAAIMARVRPDEKIIIGRNCHKSAMNGIGLAGGKPIYIYPENIREFGVEGEIKPQKVAKAMDQNPDARTVFITSPNYYGVCSDIEEISRVVHSRGGVLIVDQAHGAHLPLFNLCGEKIRSAEQQGADLVINSIHKTLCSFTQTAVLNVCGGPAIYGRLDDALQIMETSSPSYLLMMSLDINMKILEEDGEELAKKWIKNIKKFKKEADDIPGLRILSHPMLDPSKINLDMTQIGISGRKLSKLLADYNINMELETGNLSMAMTGIGNKDSDYKNLINALRSISSTYAGKKSEKTDLNNKVKTDEYNIKYRTNEKNEEDIIEEIEKMHTNISDDGWEKVHFSMASGRIAAKAVIPYPPGIALIPAGTEVEKEQLIELAELISCGTGRILGLEDGGFIYCLAHKEKK